MGVAVRRYIDFLIIIITIPLLLALCLAAASLLLCSFKKCFFFVFMLFLCNIANVAQRTFEIVQKSRSREHGDIIISTRMYVDCARAQVPRLPCVRHHMTLQESCS